MDKKLFTKALSKFTLGFLLVGALLFLPAGSLAYWNGWLLMGVLFVPMFAAGIVLMIRNEEAVLTRKLPGYDDYKQKVKYKVLPFIW